MTQIPGILQKQGFSPTDSVAVVFIVAVMVAIVGTTIAGFGLRPAPIQREKTKKKPLPTLLAEGFREAKKNPRITLAYTASMAAR